MNFAGAKPPAIHVIIYGENAVFNLSEWEYDGFVKAPMPFHDYLLISSPGMDAKGFFPKSGFFHCASINAKCKLYSTAPLEDNRLLSGYAFTADGFLYGHMDESASSSFDILKAATGNFTYLEIFADSMLFCHDFFGLGSLFYYDDGHVALVSNRLHLVAIGLYELGVKDLPLNRNFVHSLVMFSYLYKDQPFNNDTPIAGVCNLDLDYTLTVADGRVWLLQRSAFEPHLSYSEALESARLELGSNLSAVGAKLPEQAKHIDLSAGKDSRTVLGLALACPYFRDNFDIVTQDNAGSDDLAVSLAITRFYGLKYRSEQIAPREYLPLAFNYDIYRSYLMGMYNRMPPLLYNQTSTLGANNAEFLLNGHAGEHYRMHLADYFQSGAEDSFENFITANFNDTMWVRNLDEEARASLLGYIHDSLRHFYGCPTLEAGKKHYEWNRFRRHSGLRLYNFFHDMPSISPFQSKYLFYANSLLPMEDQINAKAIFDLDNLLDGHLTCFPYWLAWPYAQENAPFAITASSSKLAELRENYWETFRLYTESGKVLCQNEQLFTKEEEERYVNKEVAMALARIFAMHPELDSLLRLFLNILMHYQRESMENYRIMCSRILGMDDLLFPLKSLKEELDYTPWLIPAIDVDFIQTGDVTAGFRFHLGQGFRLEDYQFSYYAHSPSAIIYRHPQYAESVEFRLPEAVAALQPAYFTFFARHRASGNIFIFVKSPTASAGCLA